MRKPTTLDASKKSTTGGFRFGVGAVALLAPLALGGCVGGQFDESEDEATGVVSQALCVESDLTTATNLVMTASSGTPAPATDNNVGTRWESAYSDPQWIQVDLGASKFVSRVRIDWEAANAKDYSVRISNDATFATYTTLVTKTNMATGDHRIDDLTGLSGTGRFIRINGTLRNLTYGYSIWEMDVYGDSNANCGAATARNISNNLEAESNDGTAGLTMEACGEGGQDAGFTDANDYIEWLINVPTAGNYTVTSRSAVNVAPATYEILVNNVSKATMSLTGTGGWQTYQSFTTPSINLAAGNQTLRIKFTSGGQNLNYLKVNGASCTPTTCAAQGKNCGSISDGCGGTLTCGTCGSGQTCTANVCQASGGGTPRNISNNLEAESNDGQAGTTLEACGEGGQDAGWIDANDYIEWLINVPTAGNYTVTSRSASTAATSVEILVNGASKTTMNIASTGGWQTWQSFTTNSFALSAGTQTMRIKFTSGSQNLNYIKVNAGGGGGCTPSCSGKVCGADGCGGSCGSCPSGNGCSADQTSCLACNGGCPSGQTCNANNACVAEQCGGGCGMGQKCVNNACTNDLTAGTGYYNSGVSAPEGTPAGFWGSNTKIYSSAGNSAADIQAAFVAQRTAQFGSRRDAFLFAPGTYPAQMDIGFYTQIAGLGDHPDTVNMTGWLNAPPPQDLVDASGGQMNGTQTFWRVIENFKYGSGTTALWAVSQAAPARRIHSPTAVFKLHYDHWVSGGFLADSDIVNLEFGGQQQWYTRNSNVAGASGGSWNIVYQGVGGAAGRASQTLFSAGGVRTEIGSAPVVREKPFLYVNRDGLYKVRVPAIRTNASGTSWTSTSGGSGISIPISSFFVAKPGDTAATLNDRLRVGKHLLFTPGIYHLSQALNVTRANTVILGIGLATLIPDGGVKAMTVADVDGVTISGLLFDAGTTNSPVLLEVGPSGSSANHSANPTSLHDLFFRIGGTTAVGKATVSLQINSHNVIGDHAWVWRADHALNAGDTGWTVNTAQNGVVVNGNNVTYYGLFVEHFQQYQVLWNGNNGKTFFYQSELPYDPPNQAAYMNGSSYGWASYKVADGVTTHEGWGMGIYAVFTVGQNMQSERAIEANNNQPGVTFDSMCTTSLGPAALAGKINHIVNDQGAAATAPVPVKLVSWH